MSKIPPRQNGNISESLFARVAYLKGDDADQDARDEEDEGDDEPYDTPHFIFYFKM